MVKVEQMNKFQWRLHVDGSSNTHGSGAEIVITTIEGDTVECAMRFDFKATNNQAEYEALLAGLRVCIALGADELEIFSDSQVVVNQVMDKYQVRDEHMITYLDIAKRLLRRFKSCKTCQRIANDIRQPLEVLRSLTSPWPFAMWGLDLIRPMPT